jgi:hypothetical protein
MAPFSFPDPDGASATPPPDGRATSGAARAGGFLPDALRAQPTFFHDVPLSGARACSPHSLPVVRAGSARSLCALKMNGAPREIDGRVSRDSVHFGAWLCWAGGMRLQRASWERAFLGPAPQDCDRVPS